MNAEKVAPIRRKLPLACKLIYLLAAVSACLYFAFVMSEDFADWFNRTVSPICRMLCAKLTVWLPFSLAELLILLIPFFVVALIVIAVRFYCSSWHNTFIYLGILASVVCVILILFVWNFAAGYYGKPLDEKLGLDRTAVSAEELRDTAEHLAAEVQAVTDDVTFMPSGASVMPYSHSEMNDKLMAAYDRAAEKYDFLDGFSSSIKPIMLSEPMSYTHITGVYTFFTGEANVNVNFPDYTVPYTAAHELAHQRGIAREDEANFVAFLVCMESDDPYIRYSGFLNTYEYVASALSSADYEAYVELWRALPEEVRDEQRAYSAFFEKYRDNVAASVSNTTNDIYLKTQGSTEGVRTYDLVVELAVAYYRQEK